MKVLVYASPLDVSVRKVLNTFGTRNQGLDVVCIPSLPDFEAYVRQPSHLTELVLLMPRNRQELDDLIAIGDLIRDAKVILVLPEDNPHFNAASHRLRPCFVTYTHSDPSRLTAVVNKMAGSEIALPLQAAK